MLGMKRCGTWCGRGRRQPEYCLFMPPTVPFYSRQMQGPRQIPATRTSCRSSPMDACLWGAFKQLAIFSPTAPGAAVATPLSVSSETATPSGNQMSGWVIQINGTELTLRKRDGTHVTVDAKPAQDAFPKRADGHGKSDYRRRQL